LAQAILAQVKLVKNRLNLNNSHQPQ